MRKRKYRVGTTNGETVKKKKKERKRERELLHERRKKV